MTDIAGKAKETTGKVTGNDDLKREGQVDQAVDKVKETAEKVTDKVKDVLKKD
ncbi:CsbD family protein [Patulibacter minatonensis]|uniref:CsbD family protein n=1 Tax=Patulibacter minatonensis TaxID=298163 RepID=UPI000A041636|nr:CsbD family protein [Patulibacter minatonensis]